MKKKIHDEIVSLCDSLEMPLYQRILLIEMVYRKVKHPEENINQLIDKVVYNIVPKRYKALKKRKRYYLSVSVSKERTRLEEELHDCRNLPNEELFAGDIIENVVRYYYDIVCGVE